MQLYSRTYGSSGPHVIILHGLFGMSDNWHQVARDLSDRFVVHALDLRNHGRSPHDPVMTQEAMAEDVAEFMEQLAIPAAAIVGHSLGGKVAMTLALQRPELVLGLVVVDISPGAYEEHHDTVFDALMAFPLDAVHSREEATRVMTDMVKSESTAQFLLKNLARGENDTFEWKIPVESIRKEYAHIIAETVGETAYDGPTLFIRGENSQYLGAADMPLIERLFPSHAIDTVAGAGHWVHVDNPAGFREKVRTFLSQLTL